MKRIKKSILKVIYLTIVILIDSRKGAIKLKR